MGLLIQIIAKEEKKAQSLTASQQKSPKLKSKNYKHVKERRKVFKDYRTMTKGGRCVAMCTKPSKEPRKEHLSQ